MLAISACAPDTGPPEGLDDPAPTTEAAIDTGEGTPGAEEFPIPIPPGGEVIAAGEAAGVFGANVVYPADRYDDVVAFYDGWASGEAWEQAIPEGEPPGMIYLNVDEARTITIYLEGDQLVVNLSAGPAE